MISFGHLIERKEVILLRLGVSFYLFAEIPSRAGRKRKIKIQSTYHRKRKMRSSKVAKERDTPCPML